MLLKVQDIEDLVTSGEKAKACPYYASRMAVPDAEVVVLPYNTLLHRSTRESCGIKLNRNAVVIIDEAHNLLDTIAHIYSSEVKTGDLKLAREQVQAYFQRYSGRLSPKHVLNIKQILFIISQLIKVSMENCGKSQLTSVSQLLNDAEIFNLNLNKIVRYLEQSKLAQKVGPLKSDFKDKKSGFEAFISELKEATAVKPVCKMFQGKFQAGFWPSRLETYSYKLFYFLKLYNFGFDEFFVGSTISELQHQ